MALMLTEDVQECAAGLHAVLADARRWRTPMAPAALALAGLATLNLRCGNLDWAHRDLRTALVELPKRCLPASVRRPFLGLNALLYLERGDVEKAEEVAYSCGPAAPQVRVESALLVYARGMVRLSTGDSLDASHLLLECGRLLLNKQLTNPGWLPWRSAAAKALVGCGEAGAAVRLVAEERQLALAWGAPGLLGTANLAASAVASRSLTSEPEAEVVRELGATPYRLRYAEALIEHALAKDRCGERAGAAALLREARALARAAGARGLAERAGELLAYLDNPEALPMRSWANCPWPSLTGVEARVVDLVRSGLSDTQVALALYVNRRTIELHLTRVYRKLGLSSTEALRAMLTTCPESEG
jgi:DNA-binding CsgD family transcriptional regulator